MSLIPPGRLSDERGFTLAELLVSMSLGLVVLLGSFLAFDRAFVISNEVSDRSDALQRGRQAMELITRELRSQVCLGQAKDPITVGTDNSVTFYVDLSDGSKDPYQSTIAYDSSAKTITNAVAIGTGDYPDLVFGTPGASYPLLTKAQPVMDGATPRPIFRYYAFQAGGPPGAMTQLPTPLTTQDAARVVLVKVAFVALPERTVPRDLDSTALETDVYVRIADPTLPLEGPRCV